MHWPNQMQEGKKKRENNQKLCYWKINNNMSKKWMISRPLTRIQDLKLRSKVVRKIPVISIANQANKQFLKLKMEPSDFFLQKEKLILQKKSLKKQFETLKRRKQHIGRYTMKILPILHHQDPWENEIKKKSLTLTSILVEFILS